MTLKVLSDKGQAHTQIAATLGVSEGSVRYHKRKVASGMASNGCEKPFKAQAMAEVIDHWITEHGKSSRRPANVKELYEDLVQDHAYDGSYRSVLRFVRACYPKPAIRTYRRLETVPGAQSQTDWGAFPRVNLNGELTSLQAFVMTLSHSRMAAVIWSPTADQFQWHRCHNEAFTRLGGIVAVNRIDNLKTGVAKDAGACATINPSYRAYASQVRFHIDPCPPRAGNAKGKVEAKVKLSRYSVSPYRRQWDSLEQLQQYTDQRIDRWAHQGVCPATGLSVHDSWQNEKRYLQPLPILPEPFDVCVTRTVRPDCTVYFEGRYYAVPFEHASRQVEVRGCTDVVQILAEGRILRQYPRGTAQRLLYDLDCYEGTDTAHVRAPAPLGKMGRKLEEIRDMPVEARPIDLYAALAEVAR